VSVIIQTGAEDHPNCAKCKLFENSNNPFIKPVWFDNGKPVFGLPSSELLQQFKDWLVVVAEPPPKSFDTSGDLSDWKSLQKLQIIWSDLGILERIIVIPAVRCYPLHEDGRPKITHTQLKHCLKINWEVINLVDPQIIFPLGFDACRVFTGRGDDFNIGGRVYHWSMDKVEGAKTYAVIPMWGFSYVNRDTSRYQKPYNTQWKKAVALMDSSDLSVISADVDYTTALSVEEIEEWFKGLSLDYPFGFDVETTSLTQLGPWAKDFTITCASFAHPKSEKPLIIPLDYKLIDAVLQEFEVPKHQWPARYKKIVVKLREILENPRIKKIGHNIKFDAEAVWKVYDIELKGIFQDTMLLNYALNPDVKRLNSLDDLIRKILPDLADYSLTLDRYFEENPDIGEEYSLLPHNILFPYAALDTKVLYPILEHLGAEVEKRDGKGTPMFVRIDNKDSLYPTYTLSDYVTFCRRCHLSLTLELEKNGVAIDTEMLIRIEKFYKDELEGVSLKLNKHSDVLAFQDSFLPKFLSVSKSGKPKKVKTTKINWASVQQVSAFFYDYLRLPVYYTTDKGNPSTDESSLKKLATHEQSEVARLLLSYREVSKFVDGFLNKLTTEDKSENLISDWDNRVHSSFSISNAGTGRLTSSKPNMQQIPVGGHVKRVYCSRYKRGWLIQRDYSQLEVRVLALMSRDPSLIDVFLNGGDIHLKTQTFFFGDAADKNNKPQRVICKGALFGKIYGQGDQGLFEDLSSNEVISPTTGQPITLEECAAFNALLSESYPNMDKWCREAGLQGVEGGVRSAFGFVRPLMNLRSYDKWMELKKTHPDSAKTKRLGRDIKADLRKAQNTPIQGSAADMCVFAGAKAAQILKKQAPRVKLCNLVHDSIWADVDGPQDAYTAIQVLRDTMDFIPEWIGDLLPDYDASWMDLPVIGECEIGLNAKDTFVVGIEPCTRTGEKRMLLNVPMKVAEAIHVEGDIVGEGDKAVMLVDFMEHHEKIESYFMTKRSTL
jgi:DNA polymerase I-like protein with 3'-5' exonuclease and polymerase domains